ncbi:hypothetical protein CJU89_4748 [Yarrowia sp. B02]|nr:hypothetical protein CJU89_4748 [Yarrowia sp. B02]
MAIKRHFVGRPRDVSSSDSDSGSGSESESENETQEEVQEVQVPVRKSISVSTRSEGQKPVKAIPQAQTSHSVVDRIVAEQRGQRKPVQGYETLERAESEEESSEEESESEESSSESDSAPKTFVRPKFIPKSKRGAATTGVPKIEETNNSAKTLEYIEKRIRAEQEAQRALYEEENAAELGGVDDTDDLDVEQELEDWKAREKARLDRDRQELVAREEALEREDRENVVEEPTETKNHWEAREDRKDKPRGAFYQEQDILKRDMSGPLQDDYVDKTNVPQSLLGKNVGQKGRIMHKSLKEQDTSRKRQR